jgi:hypothetical protein
VRIVDGVANVCESAQKLAQLQGPAAGFFDQRLVLVEPGDSVLQRVALDEPHGVVGTALGIRAHTVDGDDARVLQPAGDFGLGDESVAAVRIVGVLFQDLFQRHLAVQLAVESDEDSSEATLGVGPKDAEPLAVGGGRPQGVAGGSIRVIISVLGRAVRRSQFPEGRLDLGVAGAQQTLASRASDSQHGDALLNVAAKRLNMHTNNGLDSGATRGIEVAKVDEMVGQGSGLLAHPGGECRDQRLLIDQTGLEG